MDGQYPYYQVQSDSDSSDDGVSSSNYSSVGPNTAWYYDQHGYPHYIPSYGMPYHPMMNYPPPMPTYGVPFTGAYPNGMYTFPRPRVIAPVAVPNRYTPSAPPPPPPVIHACNACRIKMGQPPLPNQIPDDEEEEKKREVAMALNLYDIAAAIDQQDDDELTADLEKMLIDTMIMTDRAFK
ncbi:formin-like protein 20 isoform X2 [Teleopsis dalmanni]|nr:formin-like protein 20 isoform X2 [Teleopsis dalmanni]